MPAAITEFVDVTVNVQAGVADKFQFGVLLGAFTFAGADRQYGPFFSAAQVVAASLGSSDAEAWAAAVFAQDDGVESVIIGRIDSGDATLTAALDAIEAADPESFYILNVETRTDADILLAAAWVEARQKIYIAQSSDADILSDTPGNIAEDLETAGYLRTALIYHDDDTEWLDGAWSSSGGGLNLDVPGGVGVWAFRSLESIPFDSVTATEAANIYSNNANLYGRNLGLSFTSKGTMAEGRFIDITTTIDWVTKRSEEAVLSLFVSTPTKVPYTDAGITAAANAFQAVLDQGVSFGHFDSAQVVNIPAAADIASATKQTRELTLQAEAVFAGAIQKLNLTLNISF